MPLTEAPQAARSHARFTGPEPKVNWRWRCERAEQPQKEGSHPPPSLWDALRIGLAFINITGDSPSFEALLGSLK